MDVVVLEGVLHRGDVGRDVQCVEEDISVLG